MTEEIIKECKNCDALGFDSEIGVYYCCLSHRQDDLPIEFTCDDFVPNKQLLRLEQENKELKEKITSLESEIRQKKMTIMMNNDHYLTVDENNRKYRSALEEILESAKFAQCLPCGSGNLEDCLNCDDDTTNNGQFCMEKRLHEIKTKCVEVLSINS